MALFNNFSTIQANFGTKIQSCQLNFWLFCSVWLKLTLSTKHNFCISVLKMNEARFARLWISFFSRKLNFTSSKNSSSHRTSQRLFFIFFQSNYFSPRSSCLLDCIAHCVSFFCEMTQFVRSHRDQEEEEAWSWLFSNFRPN